MRIDLEPAPGELLPVAAYAASVTTGALRHWCTDGHFKLLVPQPTRAWRRFSPADIVRAATVGRLVASGFEVAEAVAVVGRLVDPYLESAITVCGSVPWVLLHGELHGLVLRIERAPGCTLKIDVGEIVADVEERLSAVHAKADRQKRAAG